LYLPHGEVSGAPRILDAKGHKISHVDFTKSFHLPKRMTGINEHAGGNISNFVDMFFQARVFVHDGQRSLSECVTKGGNPCQMHLSEY
jgi:hypothetical protein